MGARTGRPPGKPTKLTPRTFKRMLSARKCGLSMSQACLAVGVDAKSHINWMARGEADAGAGRQTIFALYFQRVPAAVEEGRWRLRQRVLKATRSGDALAVARGKLALAYEAMIEAGKLGVSRRRALRAATTGAPSETPQESGQPADLSRLTDEKLARYTALTAKAREDITSVTAEEFLELQALLRETRQAN